MNVGEMTLSSKWMRKKECWRNDCLSQMDEHGRETRREKEDQETSEYARERERERAREKTATAEDAQIQVHDCVAEREELRKEEPRT